MPRAILVVLVEAGASERERHVAVERLTTWLRDLEAGVVVPVIVVASRIRKVERDGAHGVDQVDHTGEVDGHEVIDRYSQCVLDGLHQRFDAIVEGRVDLVLRGQSGAGGHTRKADERVARNRQHPGHPSCRIHVHDLDRVASLTADLAGASEGPGG